VRGEGAAWRVRVGREGEEGSWGEGRVFGGEVREERADEGEEESPL